MLLEPRNRLPGTEGLAAQWDLPYDVSRDNSHGARTSGEVQSARRADDRNSVHHSACFTSQQSCNSSRQRRQSPGCKADTMQTSSRDRPDRNHRQLLTRGHAVNKVQHSTETLGSVLSADATLACTPCSMATTARRPPCTAARCSCGSCWSSCLRASRLCSQTQRCVLTRYALATLIKNGLCGHPRQTRYKNVPSGRLNAR